MKEGSFFYNGAIPASYATSIIGQAGNQVNSGAHSIFLGQVRGDKINGKKVTALSYSAHTDLCKTEMDKIMSETKEQFDLLHTHIRHSLGEVATGDLCLFIFVSSAHRKESIEALNWLIEAIKNRLPIFAKEILTEQEYVWKVNK